MIGLTKPSSGAAYVDGLDINKEMDKIYTVMGVCPQHEYETVHCKVKLTSDSYLQILICLPPFGKSSTAYFGIH